MKQKVLLFDFDKTLTKGDSILELWRYCIKNKIVGRGLYHRQITKALLSYSKHRTIESFKNEIYDIFNYVSKSDLEDFANHLFRNFMLRDGVNYFNNLDRDYALLVSASTTNYLTYFKELMDFDYIIGTELDDNNKILGKNNSGKEKVRRVKNLLQNEGIIMDYETSCGFTDSYKNDSPMLSLVLNKYLINSPKKYKGYINLMWK